MNNLREIQALRRLSPHPHIIKLQEVLYDQPTGRLALVFELMVCVSMLQVQQHATALDSQHAVFSCSSCDSM